MLLRHSFIVIHTIAFILMVQSLFAHTPQFICTWRNSPCFPLVSPSTYLAPSSCDGNRPPSSQVACKLTPFAPLHPVDPPFPNPWNPTCPAPNNDDLGNILALGVQNTPFLRSVLELRMAHCRLASCCPGLCPWSLAFGPKWRPSGLSSRLLRLSLPSWFL
jgi:hypothetical protein